LLADDDVFCGNCGTRAAGGAPAEPRPASGHPRKPWPEPVSQPAAAPRPAPAEGGWPSPLGQPPRPDGFFRHAAPRHTDRMSNPTRYLCAAAYLNPWYANWVTGGLLASHRAVAPSVDADVGPIIRHCLHARRIALIRDLILTAVLIAGLVVATWATVVVLVLALGLAFIQGPAWQRRSAGAKVAIGAGVVAALAGVVVLVLVVTLVSHLGQIFGSAATGEPATPSAGTATAVFVLTALILLAAIVAPVVIHTYVKYRTLSERLRPGATPMRFTSSTPAMEQRIAQVEAAQWGNVTLYSGENPFVGTGKVSRAWSIAIELDRATPSGREFPLSRSKRGYVPIDPVELHQVIRDRLVKLNDPGLPANERIAALTVEDHVVGEGLHGWDSPLIDPALKIPYSQAGPEAIEALMRHPQAGLRYYQRVSVSDKGQPVLSNGQLVIADADQEVAVSAFVYVAVEGRMFYLEFVATVMPPILRGYHIIDGLPKLESGPFMAKVFQEAASNMFADLLNAPVRAARTLRQLMRESNSFARGGANSDYIFSDIGVRNSARGLGASLKPRTYIQTLDVTKYAKIIERLLADTVLDFLADKGADTTAYANSASTVINGGTFVSVDTNYGGVAVGQGAVVNMTPGAQQQQQSPPSTAAS
jgi:hypothetical protein